MIKRGVVTETDTPKTAEATNAFLDNPGKCGWGTRKATFKQQAAGYRPGLPKPKDDSKCTP